MDGFFFVGAEQTSSCSAVRIRGSTHRRANDASGSPPVSMRRNASARMPSTLFRRARDASRMALIAFSSSRKSAQSGLCSAKKSLPGKSPKRSVYPSVAAAAASLHAPLAVDFNSFAHNGSQIKPL
jgi:hypothetical protein